MTFQQILHADLGCASYVVADQGEAVVVDPKWEIDEYLHVAADAHAQILHVLETHTHADHVSGRRRLARATGARTHVPPAVGAGDIVRVGRVALEALATPGHRPEHVAYLVHEPGRLSRLLSGDSLLVGDLARPDLAVAAEEGARDLWDTARRLLSLADDVEIWPAHVGGSLCASRSASTATSSTIGDERRNNPLLSLEDAGAFSAELTRCIPARPPSVDQVVALNRAGASHPGPVRELDGDALGRFLEAGVCVLDIRDPDSFDAAHLDGAINLPTSGRGFGTRAGWAAGADEPIVLLAQSLYAGSKAAESLRAAGVWNIAGVSAADPRAWRVARLAVRTADALAPVRVASRIADGTLTLIDVRDPAEWSAGHIAGSRSLPLSELGDGLRTADALDPPLAVVCTSGVRAALAASILRRRGRGPVWRVRGGVEQLGGVGLPLASR